MDDNLQKYLPEYDPDAARISLSAFSKADLVEMLIRAYMEKRLLAKMLDEHTSKARRVTQILAEPYALLSMPGIPTGEDLRRMIDPENDTDVDKE